MRTLLALALTLAAAPAFADGGGGIAFAQAEEGTWWCNAENAAAGLQCAREKCEAEAGGQGCLETLWCAQARWSGLLTVFLSDFHTTHVVCGAPSEAALTDTFRSWCAASEGAGNCDFSISIDPEGTMREDVGESFPGPAAQ